jgi:ABC-type maltose transport system permease subunit
VRQRFAGAFSSLLCIGIKIVYPLLSLGFAKPGLRSHSLCKIRFIGRRHALLLMLIMMVVEMVVETIAMVIITAVKVLSLE